VPATKVHFNGSVNLADTETVMREIASRVPAGVSRIPDGETGERSNWFTFQLKKFAATPGIASSAHPGMPGFPRFRVSGDVPARELAWPDPGYADIYGASYQVFTRLRAEGAVPGGIRFQAQFPTPMVFISAFAPGEDYDALLARSERAMFADLDNLVARIPHDDLAVQWDVAGEVIQLASALGAPVDQDRIPGLLARCLDRVPADVPAGLHLCYGDAGHQHTIEPQSLELQVVLINSVVAAAHRPLSWVSFTVPQDRSDRGFFAPLRSLRTGAAERYFGLVPYHPARQGAGTIQRQARLIETYLPRDVTSEWGISTECGMGRVGQAADVLALLDAHRDILASLEEVRAPSGSNHGRSSTRAGDHRAGGGREVDHR